MLFSPDAHEALADEPWSAERGTDGDRLHRRRRGERVRRRLAGASARPVRRRRPGDAVPDVYGGGAGVVEALHRLARRGFVELRRDYVPYLERSLEAPSDFPDEDAERSLWGGKTGIRLVLQRRRAFAGESRAAVRS